MFTAVRTVGRTLALATCVTLLFRASSGALDLRLPGYDYIPTDGSAVILITDIGTSPDGGVDEDGQALICRHNITNTPGLGDWYYNGTEVADRVDSTDHVLGWRRNRGPTEGVVRLRSLNDSPQRGDSVEGVYSCVVERGVDNTDVVSVGLYYNISALEVLFQLTSPLAQEYSVICRSTNGTVLNSSFTGPAEEALGQLEPLELEEYMRGNDNYSITVNRTGGSDGDTYHCMVSNGVSSLTASLNLSVADPPTNITIEQLTSSTVNVSWTAPTAGAAVTGYVVHYSGGDHRGTVSSEYSTSVLLHDLVPDGRNYTIAVETQSAHVSGVSMAVFVEPCIVPEISVMAHSSTSLSLSWDPPEHYSGTIAGWVHYSPVAGGSVTRLFVEDSAAIPDLVGLTPFTNYSVQMALVDSSNQTCVFGDPVFAMTALGPVQSLVSTVTTNSITISWSPPNAPTDAVQHYKVTYQPLDTSTDNIITVNTMSPSLTIPAAQGDRYNFSVEAYSSFGPGDSATITATIDYALFQLLVSGVGNCSEWRTTGRTTKLSDISNEVIQLLQTQCNCAPQIQEAEFYCFPDAEQYVTFRGRLYAPLTVAVDTLLAHLEDWVRGGASIRVSEYRTIDADCELSIATVEDMECEAPTQPTPKTESVTDEGSSSGISVVLLGGVAAGSFVLGMVAMLVLLAACCGMKKCFCSPRRRSYQTSSNDAELQKNPMYDEHCDQLAEHSASFSYSADRYRPSPACSPGATYESLDTTLNQAYGASLEPHSSFSKGASYKPQLPPPRNSFSRAPVLATHATTFHPPVISSAGGEKSADASPELKLTLGNSFSKKPATAVPTKSFQPAAGSPVGGVKNPVYGSSSNNNGTTEQYTYVDLEQGRK